MIKTRTEFKEAYAELQNIITTHNLTTYTHIDQVLPIMVVICTQQQCTSMTLIEWERYTAMVQDILEYVRLTS